VHLAPARHLSRRSESLVAFGVFFLVILILKFRVLDQPPVWDGAMSIFPAANTLADHNFNLGFLLKQPGFASAGPNVHSLSPITWLTAGVISLLGSSAGLLPTLHLVHFAIAAAAMAGFFQFVRPLGVWLAGLTSVAALATPVVLTQAGYVYLEFPMLAATVYGALAWVDRDVRWAVGWSVVAVLIKGSGIIVPFALAGAALFDPRSSRPDLRSGVLLIGVPSAVLLAVVEITSTLHAGVDGVSYSGYVILMMMYLVRIPDVLVLMIAYFLVVLAFARWNKPGMSAPEGDDVNNTESEGLRSAMLITSFLIAAFLCFYLAVPLVEGQTVVNPRYYVQIVPFALFGTVAALRQQRRYQMVAFVLILSLTWSVANRNGDFYPDNSINNFGLIERSGAYVDLLGLQLAEMRALQQLPGNVPKFYDQSTHLRFKYPLMGYADGALPNGYFVLGDDQTKDGRLENFPDDFYMMYEYPWLGGEAFRAILRQAEADSSVSVTVTEISYGDFTSQLVRVQK